MTRDPWHEFYGITRERRNDLTVMDKRFPWSWHLGLLVCLVLLTIWASVASYLWGPASPAGRVAFEIPILLPGFAACALALLLIPRVALVVWWYLTMRAQDDLKAALARRHEQFHERREIQRMTPRDFEDDGRR